MNDTINIRQSGEVSLIEISGRIVMGNSAGAFHRAVRDLLENNRKKILLDLAGVIYVDSAGIGELVSAFTAASNREGKLKLLRPPKRVKDLMKLTRIYDLFELYDDETAAVKSFE